MAEAIIFGGNVPILRVASVEASIAYYVERLGFRNDWRTPIFAQVSRERCTLFLSEGDQGHPGSWVFVGIGDADAACADFERRGARIRHRPTNYDWAYEMQVEDLDGNVLRLGADPKPGEPMGEWLDMNGRVWLPQPDGSWALKLPSNE
jgi:catechol 2,3-dioxygenase-like lactoylglutathione lyase family enzyme